MLRPFAISCTLLAAGALAPLAPVAYGGDILCLKDGRAVEADKMERTAEGITVHFKSGPVHVPAVLVLDAVLASDATLPPADAEEAAQAAKGMVRFDGKWVTVKRREELMAKRLEARRKELEQLRARREWRNRAFEKSKHFNFEFTVPDLVFTEFRDTMEAYFNEFARVWKLKPVAKEDQVTVCFHSDYKTYRQVSGAPAGVTAYFKFVRPYDLNVYYDRLDNRFTMHVIFHEANHYLQKLIDPRFKMPHFPGESLAEYYGASDWDAATKKFTVGQIQEGRLCEIQNDIAGGERWSLQKLITTDEAYEHYTWGWSLIHFLMNDKRYSERVQKFVMALPLGRDVRRESYGDLFTTTGEETLRVFMAELGIKDAEALRKLETEWHDYIDEHLDLVTAAGFGKAAMQAMDQGRPLRAMRLFKDALAKGNQNPVVYHRYAELLQSKGQNKEAIELWKKALALDPLNGEFYAYLGHTLSLRNKQDEAALRYIALGKELGYDEPWHDLSKEEE